METQARRGRRPARAQVGRELEVLVEGEGREPGTLVGRSGDQAPEIDGVVRLRGDGGARRSGAGPRHRRRHLRSCEATIIGLEGR